MKDFYTDSALWRIGERVIDKVDHVSIKGINNARHLFVQHNGNMLELSVKNGRWSVRVEARNDDNAIVTVSDYTFLSEVEAYQNVLAWVNQSACLKNLIS